jgi:uncharacterized protein involved in exopolysaccharide biosynthesis
MATTERAPGDVLARRSTRSGGAPTTRALTRVRRHWRLAAVVFLVTFAGVVTIAMSLPDIYRATATVLVEHPGTTDDSGKSLIVGELETRLQTIGQEVLSQARLLALMESFDLYPELRGWGVRALAVERLRRDIQVKPVRAELAGRPTTVAFSITFRMRDPEAVARVANALAAFYVEENAKILVRQASVARLTRLQQELVRMQEVYTARYPDVIRLKAEIAALERSPKATAAIGEDFRVLDPAVPARHAVAPQRQLFILLGLALSLGVAALAAMLADHLDGSFRILEELQPFGTVPALVTIPQIAAGKSRTRFWLTAGPIAIGLVLVVLVSYHIASGNEQLAFLFSRVAP